MHPVIKFLWVYLSLADLHHPYLGAGGDIPVTCHTNHVLLFPFVC